MSRRVLSGFFKAHGDMLLLEPLLELGFLLRPAIHPILEGDGSRCIRAGVTLGSSIEGTSTFGLARSRHGNVLQLRAGDGSLHDPV